MNLEFLVFANIVLLTRSWCLFRDADGRSRPWAVKLWVEVVVLFLLYRPQIALGGAAATVVIFGLLGARADRVRAHRDLWQLLLGLLALAALSVWFSPAAGLGFRPQWVEWGGRVAGWTALAPVIAVLGHAKLQLALFGLLVAANEANLLIRAAFEWLNLKPQMRAGAPGMVELDVNEYNRGRVVGLLERALIYGFVLNGQFGVIGFTLAAKAFTRFKELDDRRFAEYVLIGTLLSAGLAVAAAVAVKFLLRA